MRKTLLAILSILTVAPALAQVTVPPGFRVDIFADGPELSFITGLAFDGDGRLFVTEANVFTNTGRVLLVADQDGDGVAETISEYASGFGLATGLTFRGEHFPIPRPSCRPPQSRSEAHASRSTDLERIRSGRYRGKPLDLFVSHFDPGTSGTITRLRDDDGDGIPEFNLPILTNLPSDGINGNQQIAVGPGGRLYFGQGARTNSGVGAPPDTALSGTIIRLAADGSDVEVYASGLRNVFDLLFTPEGELLATENGPDNSGPNPIFGAPDELNAIVEGGDYGWPDHFGFPPRDTETYGPIAQFESGSSVDGIALVTSRSFCPYQGDIIAAQFGSFTDPSIGRRLLRIDLDDSRAIRVSELASGFGRPLDVAFGPDGTLYVADFSDVFFSPGSARIYRITAEDSDGDGTPDVCE